MKPAIGRIVHVKLLRGPCMPALVTAVNPNGSLELAVFRGRDMGSNFGLNSQVDHWGPILEAGSWPHAHPDAGWHWPEDEAEDEAERKQILGRLQQAAGRIAAIAERADAAPDLPTLRVEVVTALDVRAEINRRAWRALKQNNHAAVEALDRVVDWLNETVEPGT